MRGRGVVGSQSRRLFFPCRRVFFRAGESAACGRPRSSRATSASDVTSARRSRRGILPPAAAPPNGRRPTPDGFRCAAERLRARTTYISDHSSARSDAQDHYLAEIPRISLICSIRSRRRGFSVPAHSGGAPSLTLIFPFHFFVHAGARDAATTLAPRSHTLTARVDAVMIISSVMGVSTGAAHLLSSSDVPSINLSSARHLAGFLGVNRAADPRPRCSACDTADNSRKK